MTREEAIKVLERYEPIEWGDDQDAFDMAKEALMHEKRTGTRGVCSDLISRDGLLFALEPMMEDWDSMKTVKLIIETIPPVTPTERTGEWEHHIDRNGIPWERCSECGDSTLSVDRENLNFCPNCGARMTPYKGGDTE